MSSKRYTEEFKVEAVKQVTERGYSVRSVAARLGTTTHSLYAWRKKYGQGSRHAAQLDDQQAEIKRLQSELKRVTEERDILVLVWYAFIQAHQKKFATHTMCRIMRVHRSSYYAWIKQPKSVRQRDDERLLGLIKQFWPESGCVYGYRKTHHDLRDFKKPAVKIV